MGWVDEGPMCLATLWEGMACLEGSGYPSVPLPQSWCAPSIQDKNWGPCRDLGGLSHHHSDEKFGLLPACLSQVMV